MGNLTVPAGTHALWLRREGEGTAELKDIAF